MADTVTGKPFQDGGVVWLPVRVNGQRFRIGAPAPGDWNLCKSAAGKEWEIARKLAEAYEKANPSELAPLFAAAKAHEDAKKQP